VQTRSGPHLFAKVRVAGSNPVVRFRRFPASGIAGGSGGGPAVHELPIRTKKMATSHAVVGIEGMTPGGGGHSEPNSAMAAIPVSHLATSLAVEASEK